MYMIDQYWIDFVSEVIEFDKHHCIVADVNFGNIYELQQLTFGQMQNHGVDFIATSLLGEIGLKSQRFDTIFMNPFCSCQQKNHVQKNISKIVKQNMNLGDQVMILIPISHKNMVQKILQNIETNCFHLQYIYQKENQLQYLLLLVGNSVSIETKSKLDSIYKYLVDDGINLQLPSEICVRELLARLEPQISFHNVLKILQKQDQAIRIVQNHHINCKNHQKKLVLFLQYVFKKNLVNEALKQKILKYNLLERQMLKSQTQFNLQDCRKITENSCNQDQKQQQNKINASQDCDGVEVSSEYSDFNILSSD